MEVEQALVNLDSAARREGDARTAADSSQRFYSATEINWRFGGTSLINLEDARRTAIAAEVSLIDLQRDRVLQWITLYKALGGDWQQRAEGATGSTQTTQSAGPAPANGEKS
jgi:outer membrane protein TolC